jgi:type II secretory pathway pseudopilin PulG
MPEESGRSNTEAVVVVVAVVGLLATVGSAALGGYWANKGVERQFKSQRSAEIQDQRRHVYDEYLRAVAKECDLVSQEGPSEKAGAAAVEVLNLAGRVRLIAGPALKDAVSTATTALVFDDPTTGTSPCANNDNLKSFLDSFIGAAQPDLK